MDAIDRRWIESDHAEALMIDRQLAIAPTGVTAQHVIDLNRFCECAEDEEGYDVPKERMRALREAGLVKGGRFGIYDITDAGGRLRDVWWNVTPNAALCGHREGETK